MRKIIFHFCCILLVSSVSAQQKLTPFGRPDEAELNLKECAFEKTAGAMKLIEEEEKEIFVDYGLKVKTMRRVRIKIFSEKGYSAANIKIPYYSRTRGSKVTDIDAYIYYHDSLGNTIIKKVSSDEIFKAKSGKNHSFLRFTFPDLHPGCVIEYRYQKKEKEALDLSPWFFQDKIPTQYSAFTLKGPNDIPIIKRIIGTDSVEEQVEYDRGSVDRRTYFEKTYLKKNIPSFKPEPMMTSAADNLIRIEFALEPRGYGFASIFEMNKWMKFAKILNSISYFGQQFDKKIAVTEPLADSARKLKTVEEKIQFLYKRVKEELNWDNHQTFYSGDLAETWKEKTGNSADINLTLLNLLRRAGVAAYPLLISTMENGKADPDFMSLSQFNGLDVLVPDSAGGYVLDASRKYQSFRVPPRNVLNRPAFIADTASAEWVVISDNRPLLKSLINITADILPDGTVQGNAASFFYDHSKELRLEENDKSPEEKKDDEENEEKEFLKKDFTSLKTDSLETKGKNDDAEPLTENFHFTYEPSTTGDFIFIDPFFLSNFRKNPFISPDRQYNIDFTGKQFVKTSLVLSIPDGYEIDFVPSNIRMRMADSSVIFERVIHKLDGKIYFNNKMEVLYPLFDKEEYPNLQQFFTKMYTMLTEQIILKRKR